jgi:predicted DNA-binding protein (MmcQ/YjbR family)
MGVLKGGLETPVDFGWEASFMRRRDQSINRSLLMSFGNLRDHCIAKAGATEGFPFGDTALVFKVGGKMFATLMVDEVPPSITLKCDPERALLLRERYQAVQGGYYMNKRHWNTIVVDGTVPRTEVLELIDHSYDLVVAGLSKAARMTLIPPTSS